MAALVAAFSCAHPTGYRLADALWSAALAAVVTLAASRARRWALVWFTGLVTVGAVGSLWALFALAGLGLAIAGIATTQRSRLIGAAAGALGTVSMLRMPDVGFDGLTAIVVAIAVAPLLWSAYQMSPRSTRKRSRRAAMIGGGLVLVALVGFALPAFVAEPELRSGANEARRGLDALRDGNQELASRQLRAASNDFTSADDQLSAPWALPARFLPLVGPQARALSAGAEAGAEISSSGAAAATDAPYRELQPTGGNVDLALIEQMQEPVANVAGALRSAEQAMADVQTSWLAPPVADAVDELSSEIQRALPEAELAAEALEVAPDLLGADGERRYLVLFTTPSETRFLGGFAGTYGVLTADDGHVSFESSVSTGTLGAREGERDLTQFPQFEEFERRHGRYNLDRYFQNTTAAPDLPSNAEVTRALYEQGTGERIDGVVVIDPYAVASMLEVTGPVRVEGLAEPLTAENAAEYLLHEQYLDYGDEGNAERRDVLGAASAAMFEALLSNPLPGPAELGRVLGPVAHQSRLLFHSFDPAERALFERLGMDGALAVDREGDYVSLRTANSGANKIDWFLRRSLRYDASYDPSTGIVDATATVELRNDSPSGGLPRYVIGNIRDEPLGTNTMYLSLYSPLGFESATVDGRPVGIEVQQELGANTYSRLVSVPPGSTVTFEVKLRGAIHTGADYRLSVLNQPMVNDDQLSVSVRPATDEWHIASATGPGVTLDGSGVATSTHLITTDERFLARFEP